MSEAEFFQPRVEQRDVRRPVRLDPLGVAGPTRGQARGRAWRACAQGWYVPSDTNSDEVDQRILEQGVTVAGYGAITAWASLRWQGAAYFDGTGTSADDQLPIPILRSAGGTIGSRDGVSISREQLPPKELRLVEGIKCTIPERALFDEMRRRGLLRSAVVAAEMTIAARLTCAEAMSAYVATRNAWTGVPFVRKALAMVVADARSPQETWMRLMWEVDAGLPRPLVNQPIFDLRGNLLGIPDLLDPELGVVGEYDGAAHKHRDRHQRDVAREQLFRAHGLECFSLVGGDMTNRSMCVDSPPRLAPFA